MVTQIVATDIELIVLRWLDSRKILYQFQTSLAGGLYELGGSVLDFIIGNIALRIMGEYWHKGVGKEATDAVQKELLSSMGYTVVDLYESDIKERLNQTMEMAIKGQEMLR